MKKILIAILITCFMIQVAFTQTKTITYEIDTTESEAFHNVMAYMTDSNGSICGFPVNGILKKTYSMKKGDKIFLEVKEEDCCKKKRRAIIGYPKPKINIRIYIDDKLWREAEGEGYILVKDKI